MTDLPIHAVLPGLLNALKGQTGAVLVAPPGAGKTTAVAPALLDQPWCDGMVILTSPRRVAARAAAERMAQVMGEKPGETVGYVTRLDSRQSPATRILVMTEAIFVNRIVADPELPGVSAVLFDEAHERHLDSDLGLALALESRAVLREDLRVLVMSATIDGARFAALLGDHAPVVESEGKAHPLDIRWLGASPHARTEDAVAAAVLTAWRETAGNDAGDVLAFLPGVREIERVRERLEARLPDVPILPLHGQVAPQDQRTAIRRDEEGRRRIVLATAIAETSLTLDGVSVVVDSGLARHAEFDRAAGTTHLVTRRASQAAADQRAGRAARQRAGVAYRLWEEGGHGGRPAFAPPEIVTADLAPLLLKLAKWGTRDPDGLAWLDAPPAVSVAAARLRLEAIGAIDEHGQITPLGERISALPLPPDWAAAVLHAAASGEGEAVAQLALLAQERGLGGQGEDLGERQRRWLQDRSPRAVASRKLAAGWARQAHALCERHDAERLGAAVHLARAMPDRIARRRGGDGEQWLSAGGRGFQLDPASSLARAEWLVVADAQGQARGARITAGLEIGPELVESELGDLVETRSALKWNAAERRVEARAERRLGAITLSSGPDPVPDPERTLDMLVEKAVDMLGTLLPPGLLARARHAAVAGLSLEALAGSVDLWLRPLLQGRRDLALPPARFGEAALNALDWDARQTLDRVAPREFVSPAGTHHAIDYAADGGPSVEVRVQALFGLDTHPSIGATPLLLQLTSPAGRPIQATRDLPGFWRGSWGDVKKDMKGRYPKHRWPDEPWTEKPSLKTKNAFNR